jgi:hypothetical protein
MLTLNFSKKMEKSMEVAGWLNAFSMHCVLQSVKQSPGTYNSVQYQIEVLLIRRF